MKHDQQQGEPDKLEKLSIDTIRTLSMDAVEKAKSGHPGSAMGLAPAMYALWANDLVYDPAAPHWPARDRFVLSGGHVSMLLYAMIHLAGIEEAVDGKTTGAPALTVEDIRNFRQLGSRTPGHPEYGHTTGVEVTTGPLAQGCANAVGMAMAQRWLAARYDRPGFSLFDYRVTAFAGDGDMMEGLSSEAASLAGHLELGNLTWVYDRNSISIEGDIAQTFTEDVGARFEAFGWHVIEVAEGQDVRAVTEALQAARQETSRPSLVIINTVIGFGAPGKAGKAAAHGEPLGTSELEGAKRAYGWPEDAPPFHVPEGVREHVTHALAARGTPRHQAWEKMFADYRKAYPQEAAELDMIFSGRLPRGWEETLPSWAADPKGLATRQSAGAALNALASAVPWMVGGAADLAPSTKTTIEGGGDFQPPRWGGNYGGRNIRFGVREQAMGAICNGMALSGLRSFCAGFMIFSDYMKPPIRLSALMGLPVTYVFTHDSIGVGEDGPTHQPIEQLAQLRATPNLTVIRPADANEAAEAWRVVMKHDTGPVALALTRQAVPTLDRTKYAPASLLAMGGYVLANAGGNRPEVILMASGSEVPLVVAAYERLVAEGVRARVVSLPSWELFEAQEEIYRRSVLPPFVKARVGVEMGAPLGWDRYVGPEGTMIAMRDFGVSAPAPELMAQYGFTVDNICKAARAQIAAHRPPEKPRAEASGCPYPHGEGAPAAQAQNTGTQAAGAQDPHSQLAQAGMQCGGSRLLAELRAKEAARKEAGQKEGGQD
ncbi:transketolase [Oecophyllibacter saccharovorans]|uniref:transketolase n=1 Tax=Oecophyllibacter saccharovorans TaxID=2558360 RepID=UPI00240DEEB7|nr:transketolase [Oecophyllibacter saccharovorans]